MHRAHRHRAGGARGRANCWAEPARGREASAASSRTKSVVVPHTGLQDRGRCGSGHRGGRAERSLK
ncbi:MAG: hypothetical protein ACLR3C_02930 [Eggerthella lenta]